MATVTEKRAWLREHRPDLDVPDRGRLAPEYETAYAEAHDDPGDVTEPDFGGLTAAEREPDTPLQPEREPATPRSTRRRQTPRQRVRSLFGPAEDDRKPKTKAKAKRKPPRVSVEHLVSRCWEGLARVAQPLSLPVSRCLQVQSPVAGMILEEIVEGTIVDRALQPVARAEEKAEKVLALVAPPLLVATLEQTAALEAAGAITAQQAMMRRAFQVPLLKESLRIWLEVAGPKVEAAARKEAEYAEKFGHTIDELLALFFGPVTVTAETAEPEPAMAS